MTDGLQWILNAAVWLVLAGTLNTLISAAQRSALARRSRVYQLHAERYWALLLAGESSKVTGQLSHTSFGSCRPVTTSSASQHPLTVPPRYRLNTFGSWAFSVSGPASLNSLEGRDQTLSSDSVIQLLRMRTYLRVIKHTKHSRWFMILSYINSWMTMTVTGVSKTCGHCLLRLGLLLV